MPRPLNRVLGAFGLVYKPDDPQQAPANVDLGAVQPVHDVSREAEIALLEPQRMRLSTTHGGVGTLYGSSTFATVRSTLGVGPREDLWLIGIEPSWTSGTVAPTVSVVAISRTNYGVVASAGYRLLFALGTAGGVAVNAAVSAGDNTVPEWRPMRITQEDTGSLLIKTTSGGAGTANYDFLFWVVPRGTLPPDVS